MLETWERKVDGALIEDIKVKKNINPLSPPDLDNASGSECITHQDIITEDLEFS